MTNTSIPATFVDLRSDWPDRDWIGLDAEFLRWDQALVHMLSHGLHFGNGVFEGGRAYGAGEDLVIFRWSAHLKRFFQSARVYDLERPHSRTELTDVTMELLCRQGLGACQIRPLACSGAEWLGIDPSGHPTRVAVAAWPIGRYLGEGALDKGVDVVVSSWRRVGSSQLPTTAKATGPSATSVLATREASWNEYDAAILLNACGTVAEGPGENLVVVRDEGLLMPGFSEDVLPDITLDSVVTIARDLGYPVRDDASIGRDELLTADELFFGGTAAEITPIRSVNDVTSGVGVPGPITATIQDRSFDAVHGRLDRYRGWLPSVERPMTTGT